MRKIFTLCLVIAVAVFFVTAVAQAGLNIDFGDYNGAPDSSFGGAANRVYAKLKDLPRLRNDVFHFKRELNVGEYEMLRETRD